MNIGIYIYDEAEVLDFSGPFEVFSTAKRLQADSWNVFLIAERLEPVRARGGFMVTPHYSIDNHPELDVLIVVGGVHTDELDKPGVIEWIKNTGSQTTKVASVCTGAFLLAKAGLLDGLKVTTHWEDIPDLMHSFPQLRVVEKERWVCDGKYVTSGGISAGIDMSLFLVSELHSKALAELTAKQMEYRYLPK
ncbi:DJ-1/PfpI family protein [Vibrio sp. SCSIO 43137]|uniref:DJ-1/PfpI family protein n=1 Tax=Vibrio sp. SCSIO 43137 TaxID=3021011 RepID=UPI0023077970|nr:DJ-1/PfpI family protein [Vibrio sp. SCSIO 43137]WCE32535.1 DJ-1/PfpI family protein [Vibrio sp. SCSIO 43137]